MSFFHRKKNSSSIPPNASDASDASLNTKEEEIFLEDVPSNNGDKKDSILVLNHSLSTSDTATTTSLSKTKSVDYSTKKERFKSNMYKYLKCIGPGLLISSAYMDPGNYSVNVTAGAKNKYAMLVIVLCSTFIAVFLQGLCIKLGTVTGNDLGLMCRKHLPRWCNWFFYVCAEIAIIATDISEVIGFAIALNILMKIPLPAGVVISTIDVLLVVNWYKTTALSMKVARIYEWLVAALVLGVTLLFCVQLGQLPAGTKASEIFRGYVPSKDMFKNNGIYTATSVLGSTVMPHSLYVGSSIVKSRLLKYDVDQKNYDILDDQGEVISKEEEEEKKFLEYRPSIASIEYTMKYSMWEMGFTLLTVALFVNSAIIIVSGSTLFGSSEAADASLYAIHKLLNSNLSKGAGTIFMVALLLSGESASICVALGAQIVSEGHLNWRLKPWQRRLMTRSMSMIPALIVSVSVNKEGMSIALNATQVILSVLLPFISMPLFYFTSKKKFMTVEDGTGAVKNYSNSKFSIGWCIFLWVIITSMNIYSIIQACK